MEAARSFLREGGEHDGVGRYAVKQQEAKSAQDENLRLSGSWPCEDPAGTAVLEYAVRLTLVRLKARKALEGLEEVLPTGHRLALHPSGPLGDPRDAPPAT